ncbi:STAS domain-containing protein [Alkalicoccobacillus porphyridii]|uniref:STAS domain-containing protein n=1 Tax=Alkalicoccobacillus porphyridii TaxID=2597270 RepID=A0A553ZTY0_9BACI|nr:STAS domain-containing protein [Alkalicoccobacillus porphyridii]TSB44930.1 STAS domain-containing protein [Alkalicoccobacillus porphyridii]
MPAANQLLHDYMNAKSFEITKEWYETIIEDDIDSVYAASDKESIDRLTKQNRDYIVIISYLFISEKEEVYNKVENWIDEIGSDMAHLQTPLHQIFREFMRTRDIYISYLEKFTQEHEDVLTYEELSDWKSKVVKTLDFTVQHFIKKIETNTTLQLEAQKEMINELSSPVILLQNNSALLPLVGDIDTARAKSIMENTLAQCALKGVDHLYLDLSGVVIIDTMVATEIFQLISALSIIGVQTTLSGIRPEIAQTAVQLGLSFENISIKSTLAQALAN